MYPLFIAIPLSFIASVGFTLILNAILNAKKTR